MLGARLAAGRWMKEQLLRLASGDLSREYAAEAGDSALAAAYKKAVWNLKTLLRMVDRSSRALHANMEGMKERSAAIAGQVEAVTGTVREIAAGMQDTSEQSSVMLNAMMGTDEELQSLREGNRRIMADSEQFSGIVAAGKRNMEETKQAVESAETESERLQDQMSRLQASLDRIAEAVGVISDISGQTSLLALNANIEAARAGEEGRGFAIVASEVSKLSALTKEAASRIGDTVQALTADAARLDYGMKAMNGSVRNGVRAMGQSLEHYAGMEAFLTGLTDRIRDANGRLSTLAESSASIVSSLSRMSAVMQETAAGCEEMLASAEVQQHNIDLLTGDIDVTAQGSMLLRSIVSQFVLPARSELTPLQKALERWAECAFAVRSVMVSLIDCREIEQIRYWYREKERAEARMEQARLELEACSSEAGQSQRLQRLAELWEQFDAVKNQNARWMLGGEYEKAKQGLVSQGRLAFKAAMDCAAEWLETR
jgi:Methyl-accepting chemotaxis protein